MKGEGGRKRGREEGSSMGREEGEGGRGVYIYEVAS